MNLVDTHYHLDLAAKPLEMLKEIESNKLYTIAVTNLPSVFDNCRTMCSGSKYVRAALGFHPELIEGRKNELSIFEAQIGKTKYIGEIGLDYSGKSISSKAPQRHIFEKILSLCSTYNNKIITVHSRKADEDVLNIIGKDFPGKIILHWYSGPSKFIERAVQYGFYFSINLAMTRSKKGQAIISRIPHNRILTESDGPFVKNNNEPSSPFSIANTIKAISYLINYDPKSFQEVIFRNFRSLLTL